MLVSVEGLTALEALGLKDASDTVKIFGLLALAAVARENDKENPEKSKHPGIEMATAHNTVLFGPTHFTDTDIQLCMLGDRWFNDFDSIISANILGGKSLSGACMEFYSSAVGKMMFRGEALVAASPTRHPKEKYDDGVTAVTSAFQQDISK